MNRKQPIKRIDETKKHDKYEYDISIFKDNLRKGDYLSYKELISLLKLPNLKGNQKKAQIKSFDRYMKFDYIAESKKYLIYQIYDKPLPNSVLRSDAIYLKYIMYIIILMMQQEQTSCLSMTKMSWWNNLGMINKQYSKYYKLSIKGDDKVLSLTPEASLWDINHFFDRTNSLNTEIFFHALSNLKDKMILNYREVYYCKKIGNDLMTKATAEDEDHIITCVNYALRDFNLETIKQVRLLSKKEMNRFYETVNNYQRKEYGIELVQKQWEIIIAKAVLDYEQEKIEKELDELLIESNQTFKDRINKQAKHNLDKIKDEQKTIKIGKKPIYDEDLKHISKDEEYLNKQYKLSEVFIKQQ